MKKVILPTNQNHPQIVAYKEAVEKGRKSHHVLPRGNEWVVKRVDHNRVTGVYPTQQEAIQAGQNLARNQGTDLFIHGSNGRIRDRQDFSQT